MKTKLTNRGWREITIKNINVERLEKRPFMEVYKWVDFNQRYPDIGRKRKTCDCCKEEWAGMFGDVNVIFTNEGVKAICDDCFQDLKERFDAKANTLGD